MLSLFAFALGQSPAHRAGDRELAPNELAPPPAISITNAIAGDDLFDVTVGPSCMCTEPSCTGTMLLNGETQEYRAAPRCNYYWISGAIAAKSDGTVCYTFRADYKGCTVFPSEPFASSFTAPSPGAGECARLNSASCTMRRSTELAGQWFEYKTATTLSASVDRTCDVLPWNQCSPDGAHQCCGAVDGWACRLTACPHILPSGDCARTQPGTSNDGAVPNGGVEATYMCQPPTGGWARGLDERVFESWGARGVSEFNG